MKQILEPIDVALTAQAPSIVCWRGGTYYVDHIIDRWNSRGPWWGNDEQRSYVLVSTSAGVMELFHSNIRGWMLSRLFD